jgi:hypothetical protein
VWTLQTFEELCAHLGLPVLESLDPDDKTGNGFMVVLDASQRREESASSSSSD